MTQNLQSVLINVLIRSNFEH